MKKLLIGILFFFCYYNTQACIEKLVMTIYSSGVPNDVFFNVRHLGTLNAQQIYPNALSTPNILDIRLNDNGPWVSSAGSCGMTVKTQECYEITVWQNNIGQIGNSSFSFKVLQEVDINLVVNYDYATNSFSITNPGLTQYYWASVNNPLFCWDLNGCPPIDYPVTYPIINEAWYAEAFIITAANKVDLDNGELNFADRPKVVYDAGNSIGNGYVLLLPGFHAYYDGCFSQLSQENDPCKRGFFLAAIDGCGGITFESSSPPPRLSSTHREGIIYPNPASDHLTLSNLSKMGIINKVEILNMNGQNVYEQAINQEKSEVELNVSQLSQGVYILKVDTENGQEVQKFVKE